MKKIILVSLCGLAFAASANASTATSGIYISGELGTSIVKMHDAHYDYSESYPGGSYSEHTTFDNKNKSVFGGGVALGYDFNDVYQMPIRIELAVKFRGEAKGTQAFSDDDDAYKIHNKIRMDTYMVNGYYDFYNSSNVTPYLTAGIGMSHLKHTIKGGDDGEGMSATSNNFAWGVGAGLKYAITSNISVDASYRYVDGGKVSQSRTEGWGDNVYSGSDTNKTSMKAASNDLMIGVAYKF